MLSAASVACALTLLSVQLPSEWIAFTKGSNIYVVSPDGKQERRLTDHPSGLLDPNSLCWSPDGQWIYYGLYTPALDWEICRVGLGGEPPETLTTGPVPNLMCRVSPDGKTVAWQKKATGIWLMAPDGRDQRELTKKGADFDSPPSWSPDSSSLAFATREDGIYAMRLDGTSVVRLADGMRPLWSPRGNLIAFERWNREAPKLFVIAPTGGREEEFMAGFAAAWAPDGRSLAYLAPRQDPATGNRITELAIKGTGVGPVTVIERVSTRNPPSFSPNGRWIAYATKVGREEEIRVARVEGGEVRKVASGGSNYGSAVAWQPRKAPPS
jgi:TolB protein